MIKGRLLAILTVCLACSSGYAQSLKDARPTLKAGNWTVLRSLDTMTDKVSCTGIYKSNYGIQLSRNSLFIRVPGGLQSVTLRFGDNPALPMRMAQKLEKDIGSVILEGTELAQAVDTQRLRVQVLTLVRGVFTEDLDTTGLQAAAQHIHEGCPDTGAQPTPPQPAVEGLCTEQLISRLKAAGVTERQILSSCGVR